MCVYIPMIFIIHRCVQGCPLSSENQTRFFRRSNSTVCLGFPPPSPFAPLVEALPLAEQPQLLRPCQTKEAMFGFNMQSTMGVWPRTVLPPTQFVSLVDHAMPVCGGLGHAHDCVGGGGGGVSGDGESQDGGRHATTGKWFVMVVHGLANFLSSNFSSSFKDISHWCLNLVLQHTCIYVYICMQYRRGWFFVRIFFVYFHAYEI